MLRMRGLVQIQIEGPLVIRENLEEYLDRTRFPLHKISLDKSITPPRRIVSDNLYMFGNIGGQTLFHSFSSLVFLLGVGGIYWRESGTFMGSTFGEIKSKTFLGNSLFFWGGEYPIFGDSPPKYKTNRPQEAMFIF